MKKTLVVIGISLVAVAAIGYYLLVGAGAPLSSNLALVGQGKPSFVLAYENYSPTGGEALNRLRKVRGEYADKIQFLVADIGTPEGRAFAERYQIRDGLAVFLNSNGEAVQATEISADEQELRRGIDAQLMSLQ